MNTNLFFVKLAKELQLGDLLSEVLQVTGGLTHKVYRLETKKGKYIVKLLNPHIMKRPTALANFKRADELEEILSKNNIPIISSLNFNNNKMQEIDGQFFYVYEWYCGLVLTSKNIKKSNCKIIGNVLADIHNIDIKREKIQGTR